MFYRLNLPGFQNLLGFYPFPPICKQNSSINNSKINTDKSKTPFHDNKTIIINTLGPFNEYQNPLTNTKIDIYFTKNQFNDGYIAMIDTCNKIDKGANLIDNGASQIYNTYT
ncbi:MAG: hypothetical protein WCH34_09385 [Bacteroidota bacterium]